MNVYRQKLISMTEFYKVETELARLKGIVHRDGSAICMAVSAGIQNLFIKGQDNNIYIRSEIATEIMENVAKRPNVANGTVHFIALYSALFHLPLLRFHCADGCWDRTQDRCNRCIGSQTL